MNGQKFLSKLNHSELMIDSSCPNEIEHINSIWDPQSPMVTSYRHQLLDLDIETIYFT